MTKELASGRAIVIYGDSDAVIQDLATLTHSHRFT
jgi:hypothetical protein